MVLQTALAVAVPSAASAAAVVSSSLAEDDQAELAWQFFVQSAQHGNTRLLWGFGLLVVLPLALVVVNVLWNEREEEQVRCCGGCQGEATASGQLVSQAHTGSGPLPALKGPVSAGQRTVPSPRNQ